MKHYSGSIIFLFIMFVFIVGGCDNESTPSQNLPTEDFQEILEQVVEDNPVPGAIMGVHVSGVNWYGAAGVADTIFCDPMTSDMQVRLASITKPFTAVLTMKLVEEGVLSLEDTLEDLLPDHIPQGDKMTLKMLLNHSAGIADVTTNIDFWEEVYHDPERDWTHQEILLLSNPLTPVFTPGDAYEYSNTGYYLLGMILEASSGESVDDLFKDKIGGPALLNRTNLNRRGALEDPCANGYAWLFTTEEVTETKKWNYSWDWTAGSGVSTAEDMLTFADRLFNGNLLAQETVELMISPHSFAPGSTYGLGLGILAADDPNNIFGTKVIGWSGANPGTATQWYYFPDYNTTIFVAVNRNDIAEGPGSVPPVNGTAISIDILIQAWEALKNSMGNEQGRLL
jgi:D-alanyl-D-alanine carboxypeptidase